MIVHLNGVEFAGPLAIPRPEAAPTASFASARYQRRRAAGFKTGISSLMPRDMRSTRAGETCDPLFFRSRIDLQQGCNRLYAFRRIHRAFPGAISPSTAFSANA